MVEEGTDECIFDPTEAPFCNRDVVQPIYGTEAENQIYGSDKEGNLFVLPPVKITNTTEDNTAVIHSIRITIDDDNDTAPDNVSE